MTNQFDDSKSDLQKSNSIQKNNNSDPKSRTSIKNGIQLHFNFSGSEQDALLIACSGGQDSMALLHYCHQHLPNKIICAHFNHRWSASSNEAQQLVEIFCQDNNITCITEQAKSIGPTSEAKAREARYSFLYNTAKKHKIKFVLTAHHLDDQLETFFLRLARGSGTTGLEGIKNTRLLKKQDPTIFLVRPFLKNSKISLKNYCQENEILFFNDPSNEDNSIKRNHIRHNILPTFNKLESNFGQHLSELIQLIQEQNNFLKNTLENLEEEYFFSPKKFLSLDITLQRLIIKKLLEDKQIPLSYKLITSLISLIQSSKSNKQILSTNFHFLKNENLFGIFQETTTARTSWQAVSVNSLTQITIPNIGIVRIEEHVAKIQDIKNLKNSKTVFVNLSQIDINQLELRPRQAGDLFQPLNLSYKTKLKDFLINRKAKTRLDPDLLKQLPLLCLHNSKEILWIPGLEISDSIKVINESTHKLEIELLSP